MKIYWDKWLQDFNLRVYKQIYPKPHCLTKATYIVDEKKAENDLKYGYNKYWYDKLRILFKYEE